MYSKIRNSDKLDWDWYIESLPNNPLGQRPTIILILEALSQNLSENFLRVSDKYLWTLGRESSSLRDASYCLQPPPHKGLQQPATGNQSLIECQKFSNCEPESPLGLIKGHRVAGVSHQNQPQVAALGWVRFRFAFIFFLDFDKLISRTNEGLPFWITDAKKIVLSSRIKKDNSLNGDFFLFLHIQHYWGKVRFWPEPRESCLPWLGLT